MNPEELVSLLDYVAGLECLQYSILLVGVILTLFGRCFLTNPSTLLNSSLKFTTAVVWVLCWTLFPNTLVKVLNYQGPYILKDRLFYYAFQG